MEDSRKRAQDIREALEALKLVALPQHPHGVFTSSFQVSQDSRHNIRISARIVTTIQANQE